MSIPVWSYLQEYENEKAEIQAAIEKVLTSGRLILGESVKQFEQEFAHYCGAEYGVGVGNGTDAIFLGLKAIGVQAGDEVITVANTAVPTVSAITAIGAIPRFVDIVPGTYLMDTRQIEAVVTPKTKCIMPVHLFGQCVNMDEVNTIAQKHGLLVFEDCAQAHGARFGGQRAGSLALAASFSFYPTKNLGAYGDGGMVLTSDAEINGRLRRLRYYGMEKTYYAEEHGYNSRLDELHAEILRTKLRHLDEYVARRQAIAARYDEWLGNTDLILPQVAAGNEHAYHLYVVRYPRRDEIMAKLKEADILTGINYPWPIHTMRGYAYLGYQAGDLPQTEAAAEEIFSLPMFPALTVAEQEQVCAALHLILTSVRNGDKKKI